MDIKNKENNIDKGSSNDEQLSNEIFKELAWGLDFWEEKKENINKNQKDKKYYLALWLKIFIWLNIFIFIIIIISWVYLKIQNSSNLYSKVFLNPICFLLIDSEKNTWSNCSSISALSSDYLSKTEKTKNEISKNLSEISQDLYSIENFVYAKEVWFLINTKNQKLWVLNILNDFDKLKNDFSSWDKKMLECNEIQITKDDISITCNAYSSSWEWTSNNWWIIWETWDRSSSVIEWTSITIASSFLNYIDKNPQYNFKLTEKQKLFTSELVFWEWPYVRKTEFSFKLKYNNLANNLSF